MHIFTDFESDCQNFKAKEAMITIYNNTIKGLSMYIKHYSSSLVNQILHILTDFESDCLNFVTKETMITI